MPTPFPPLPDHNDPRVPAVMLWALDVPGETARYQPVLVYRKKLRAFLLSPNAYVTTRPAFSVVDTRGVSPANDYDFMREIGTGTWTPAPFRSDDLHNLRRVLFQSSDRNQRLALRGHGRMCDSSVGYATWRGRTVSSKTQFSAHKALYAGWCEPIRSALETDKDPYVAASYRRHHNAAREVIEYANSQLDGHFRELFVAAATEAFNKAGEELDVTVANCGHAEHDDDTVTDHNGNSYCESCGEDLIYLDGEYYPRDDVYYWESDGEYHTEEEPEDDEDDEDEDNGGPHSDHIMNWGTDCDRYLSHDKSFAQNTHSDFTMGVELEVECEDRHSYEDAVEQCHTHFNRHDRYAMFKKDGSLSDKGFEIVTAARRLPEHIKKFSEWTPHEDLRAWKPGNCGVHVHIDSRAFSALTLGKFLMFINADQNTAFITAIAGRHPRNDSKAKTYCAQMHQTVLTDPLKAVKGGDSSRYRMVNASNLTYGEQQRLGMSISRDSKGSYSTIELRIFRASLKKERLLAQIEFTHAAVTFCRTASWHKLTGDDFKAWLGTSAALQYKHLARWFGVRVPKADKRVPERLEKPQYEEVYA